MNRFVRALRLWLPFAVVGTALVLLAYIGVQQDLRMSADDPQIQLAEDAANAASQGAAPAMIIPHVTVDAGRSLAPWVTIVGGDGRVLASSGRLDDAAPLPPHGVLEAARRLGEDRVSWQTASGLRMATVVVYRGGQHPCFAVSGRSLREVESREGNLARIASLDYAALLIGVYLILLVTV